MLIFKITRTECDPVFPFEAQLLTKTGSVATVRIGQPRQSIYFNGRTAIEVSNYAHDFAKSLDIPYRLVNDSSLDKEPTDADPIIP